MNKELKITVYTLTTCPRCAELEAFLQKHSIPYEKKNVEQDFVARARMVYEDIDLMPAVDIDGKLYSGPIEMLMAALGEANYG